MRRGKDVEEKRKREKTWRRGGGKEDEEDGNMKMREIIARSELRFT